MQSELSRSRFAQETLEQSTAALEDLGEKYSNLSTLLTSSRTLVTALLKSTKSDTWYLETTFYILITTLVWLIFRRWLYGPISWFIILPLKIFLRIVFAVAPIGASTAKSSLAPTLSQLSTSLIVKPSATGAIPRRPVNEDNPKYVRVGGGGRGYAQEEDPSPPQSLSQSVGQMAEQNQQQQEAVHPQLREQNQQQPDEKNEPIVRGDGTVLQERSDRPRNPKKKMWDEGMESAKFEEEQRQAEQQLLQEQAAAEGKSGRKRDEL
jgi:protein transport protein SEC20